MLNLLSLLKKTTPWFEQQLLDFNIKNDVYPHNFKNSTTNKHFLKGSYYSSISDFDLAFKEYKAAEQIEPKNPSPHLVLTKFYLEKCKDFDSAKRHLLLALTYGDSQMVEYVFCFLLEDPNCETEMGNIIKTKYKDEEKVKALRYLKILYSFHRDKRKVVKVIGYNLNEIWKIIRQRKLKLILMDYPMDTPWAREVISLKAHQFKVPLVDNVVIFEDKL